MKKCLMARGGGTSGGLRGQLRRRGDGDETGAGDGFYFEFLMISRGVRPNMRFIQCAMWL
jgi:hypothetical protein